MLGFLVMALLAALESTQGSMSSTSTPPQSGYGQPNPAFDLTGGYTPAAISSGASNTPGSGPNNPNTLTYSATQTQNNTSPPPPPLTPSQQQQIFSSMENQTPNMVINVNKSGLMGPAIQQTANVTYGGINVLSRVGRVFH
jgi:hypothetical protein